MNEHKQTKTDVLASALLKLANDLTSEDDNDIIAIVEASDRLKQYQTITKNLIKIASWLKSDLMLCSDYTPARSGVAIATLSAIIQEVNEL